MLNCSLERNHALVSPLAFGEVGVKERVGAIMKYKKPAFWLVLLGMAACVAVVVCFMSELVKGNADKGKNVIKENVTTKPQATQNPEEKEPEIIKVKAPDINLEDTCGVDGAMLLFADEDRVIFGGYFGLFVYDRKAKSMYRGVDLKPIGCNMTQGEDACEMMVSEDGSLVYLHVMSREDMYVYDVENNMFMKVPFDMEGISLYKGYDYENSTASFEENGKRKQVFLVHYYDTIGELGYAETSEYSNYQPFFEEEHNKATQWKHTDIHEIIKAEIIIDGKSYVCEDKPTLYKMEQDITAGNQVKGGADCSFDEIVYLTRRDGTVGMIYLASDGSNIILCTDGYYRLPQDGKLTALESVLEEARRHEKK